jgi:hypothetical protein
MPSPRPESIAALLDLLPQHLDTLDAKRFIVKIPADMTIPGLRDKLKCILVHNTPLSFCLCVLFLLLPSFRMLSFPPSFGADMTIPGLRDKLKCILVHHTPLSFASYSSFCLPFGYFRPRSEPTCSRGCKTKSKCILMRSSSE